MSMVLLFQTGNLIEWGGLLIILLLIFAETGFLLGLVVPGGETLVFTTGILASAGTFSLPIVTIFLLLVLASVCGDAAGFYIGRRFGVKLYQKPDTWYFKKQYLQVAKDFVARHRKTAIMAGKFFPLVRPFMPVIAGMSPITKTRFAVLTFASVLLYMSTFLFTGYFLGSRFPGIKDYLGLILPASVILLLVPVVLQLRKNRNSRAAEKVSKTETTEV